MRFRTAVGSAVFAVLAAFLVMHPAFAQQDALNEFGTATQLSQESLPIIIARIIRVFLGVLGIITVVIVMYAGFLYTTSGGDAHKVDRAKMILRNAVIGLILIFSSFAITQFILNGLLRSAGTGGITGRDPGAFIEPNSGSLGAGIVQDHYPARGALEIPRNVKVFVTFKDPIDPGSLIDGFDQNPQSIALNTDAVHIFPTEAGVSSALAGDQVAVSVSEDGRTIVLDPVPLLGSADQDTNYSVELTSSIRRANGSAAFTGAFRDGYTWTFEVSTVVDLTPPRVVSVLPSVDGTHAPNTVIQLNFNEPMDPVSSTGVQDADAVPPRVFDAIDVFEGNASGGQNVDGTFTISNGYRTIEFVSDAACAQDACGATVFCLPLESNISVVAHSATLSSEPPQARLFGVRYDGLTDAAGNSLDGDGDGSVIEGDDYTDLTFRTNGRVDDRTPTILSIDPNINDGEVSVDKDVAVTFSMPMSTSTLVGSNVQLWNEPAYEMYFLPRSTLLTEAERPVGCTDTLGCTRTEIEHPTFLPADVEGGPYSYYPLVSNGAKGANQFCMYPALGPTATGGSCGSNANAPFCCNGAPSTTACRTTGGTELPPTP